MTINLPAIQQQRRDTASNWTTQNPTLLPGELGYETDTGKWKVGTGLAVWTALGYTPWSAITAFPLATADIADDAVTAAKLANTSVTAGSYTTANITVDAQGRVTSAASGAGLADGSVTTAKLADDAVTGAKLANDITIANNLTVTNNLTVNGTTTTIDSTTLVVEDKNIEIGKVSTPSDTTADGGGITLKGATDKTINWVDATDAWTFSEHLNIASAKEFRIAGTKVLDATSLGAAVVGSSLTSVGTIATGVWNGTPIATAYIADDAITSAKIVDGTIANADVNASAAIAGTKVSPDFGSQAITTTGIINANGKVSFPLGTAAAPSLLPGSDTNTGIFSPGADSLAITTAGTQRVTVDSSGNVLIGTSSLPTSDSTLTIQDSSSHCEVNIISSPSHGSLINMGDTGDYNDGRIKYDNSTRSMQFQVANAERLSIDSSGSITINAVPGTNNNANQAVLFQTSAGVIDGGSGLSYNPAEDSLNVNGSKLNSTTFSGTGNSGILTCQNGAGQYQFQATNAALIFTAGSSEKMRIDSSGNVFIGGTTASSADIALNASGAATFAGAVTADSYKTTANAVSALAIDIATGNYFTKTINGNSTFTFTNPPASGTVGSFTLELTHTSGTVTWPSSVKFPADTAPTLTAGKTHLFMFVTDDGGTRYRGAALADYVN
jgi:hypothetical protein